MAASVGEFWHVVNVDGAGFNASMAGGARPNGVLTEASDDVLFKRLIGKDAGGVVVAGWRTSWMICIGLRPCRWRRPDKHLASGGRRSPAIDEVLPGEIGVVHSPEGFNVQFIEQHRFAVVATSEGSRVAMGRRSWKKTFGKAITKCMCFESGIKKRKTQMASMCAQ